LLLSCVSVFPNNVSSISAFLYQKSLSFRDSSLSDNSSNFFGLRLVGMDSKERKMNIYFIISILMDLAICSFHHWAVILSAEIHFFTRYCLTFSALSSGNVEFTPP
jgi:hypothetical protein